MCQQSFYPLHQLLHIDKKWHWSTECDHAYVKTKAMIAAELALVYADNVNKFCMFLFAVHLFF